MYTGFLSEHSLDWITLSAHSYSISSDIFLGDDERKTENVHLNHMNRFAKSNNLRIIVPIRDVNSVSYHSNIIGYLGNLSSYSEEYEELNNISLLVNDSQLTKNPSIIEKMADNLELLNVDNLEVEFSKRELSAFLPYEELSLGATPNQTFYIHTDDFDEAVKEINSIYDSYNITNPGNSFSRLLVLLVDPTHQGFTSVISTLILILSYLFYRFGQYRNNRYRQNIQHFFGQTSFAYLMENFSSDVLIALIGFIATLIFTSVFMPGIFTFLTWEYYAILLAAWMVFVLIVNLIGVVFNTKRKESI